MASSLVVSLSYIPAAKISYHREDNEDNEDYRRSNLVLLLTGDELSVQFEPALRL